VVPGYQEKNAIKSGHYIVSRGVEYGSVSVTRMESRATEIMIKIGYWIVLGGQDGRYKFKVEFRVEIS
jgi:hypothetical protein